MFLKEGIELLWPKFKGEKNNVQLIVLKRKKKSEAEKKSIIQHDF